MQFTQGNNGVFQRNSWRHGLESSSSVNTHQLSLKLNIDKNEWSKNLPMSGENGVHMRHVKILYEEKTNRLP